MPRITLIGYRGTGKSSVAARLAERLRCPWRDADALLEERLGCTIATLVRERGEAEFREHEANLLGELLADFPGVLATGGGVVIRQENRALLARLGRPVVWLRAGADVIRRRLAADPSTRDRRPPLHGDDPLAEVDRALAEREPLYRSVADLEIDTSVDDAGTVAARIADWLGRGAPSARPSP